MQSTLQVKTFFNISWKFDPPYFDMVIDWSESGWFGFGFCKTVNSVENGEEISGEIQKL